MLGRPAAQLIRVAVLSGFFGFALVTIWRGRDNETLRKAFVVAMVIGVTVPLITNVMFPPFAKWIFFPDTAPQQTTTYTVYVVDDRGVEYDYPNEAAAPGRVDDHGRRMVHQYDDPLRAEMAAFLLARAIEHRDRLRDGLSPMEAIRYRSPRALLGRDAWSVAQARAMGELVSLRIRRVTVSTTPDGYEVTNRTSIVVFEYDGEEVRTGE